eukprot:TRINITY_DN73576_c0_g1_i1.p2 TRINITY_DN73576_c0_g1~~TRINITY_DN73576_c0_g1_i1.p2  ORF type:complete len:173 (-),score=14.04 TRINITY_DN73576_c0_g1_i1:123-641(-)
MSDLKWGFEKEYAHRHLPFKWSTSSSFSYYPADPLTKRSFHNPRMPVYGEDIGPTTTQYGERPQSERWSMSSYGVHKEQPWGESLRSPRNPFPGLPGRETRYTGQSSPCTPRGSSLGRTGGRSLASTVRSTCSPRDAYAAMRLNRSDFSVPRDSSNVQATTPPSSDRSRHRY